MQDLIITKTKDVFFTPEVNFNAETGVCTLEGESYLEDTVTFYKQLTDWLNEYMETKKPIKFDFKITYFNTSSSRSILELLLLLNDYKSDGGEIKVRWFYHTSNKFAMEEEVEDFEDESDVEIEMVAFEE